MTAGNLVLKDQIRIAKVTRMWVKVAALIPPNQQLRLNQCCWPCIFASRNEQMIGSQFSPRDLHTAVQNTTFLENKFSPPASGLATCDFVWSLQETKVVWGCMRSLSISCFFLSTGLDGVVVETSSGGACEPSANGPALKMAMTVLSSDPGMVHVAISSN